MTPPCPFCDVESPPKDHVIRCADVALRRAKSSITHTLTAWWDAAK